MDGAAEAMTGAELLHRACVEDLDAPFHEAHRRDDPRAYSLGPYTRQLTAKTAHSSCTRASQLTDTGVGRARFVAMTSPLGCTPQFFATLTVIERAAWLEQTLSCLALGVLQNVTLVMNRVGGSTPPKLSQMVSELLKQHWDATEESSKGKSAT